MLDPRHRRVQLRKHYGYIRTRASRGHDAKRFEELVRGNTPWFFSSCVGRGNGATEAGSEKERKKIQIFARAAMIDTPLLVRVSGTTHYGRYPGRGRWPGHQLRRDRTQAHLPPQSATGRWKTHENLGKGGKSVTKEILGIDLKILFS